MIDPAILAKKLLAFFDCVRSFIPSASGVYWEVAFPADDGLLLGSPLGKRIWGSGQAKALLNCLLADKSLASFRPPPKGSLVELRFIFAAAAQRWIESGEPAQVFASNQAAAILQECQRDVLICYGLAIVQGIRADHEIVLPLDWRLAPLTLEQLRNMPVAYPVSQADVIRLPDKPTAVLLVGSAASRSAWGAYAGTTALGFARVALERLRECLWLATGTLPTKGDEFLWFDSPYAPPLERITVPPEKRFGRIRFPDSRVDHEFLKSIVARRTALWRDDDWAADDETWLSWWMSEGFVHAALDAGDPLLTVLMSYAALDGLLRQPGDDDSWLAPRVGWLIASDHNERRDIGRLMTRAREIRGQAAHGYRPHLHLIGRAVGQELTHEEIAADWPVLRDNLYKILEYRCLELLRRGLLAFSWLVVDVDNRPDAHGGPVGTPLMSRGDILSLLDRARANDAQSQRLLSDKLRKPRAHVGDWPPKNDASS